MIQSVVCIVTEVFHDGATVDDWTDNGRQALQKHGRNKFRKGLSLL